MGGTRNTTGQGGGLPLPGHPLPNRGFPGGFPGGSPRGGGGGGVGEGGGGNPFVPPQGRQAQVPHHDNKLVRNICSDPSAYPWVMQGIWLVSPHCWYQAASSAVNMCPVLGSILPICTAIVSAVVVVLICMSS